MSVNTKLIGYIGIKLDEDNLPNEPEDLEELINNDEYLDAVFDGMCSEYLYIGKKLFEINYNDFENVDILSISPEKFKIIKERVFLTLKQYNLNNNNVKLYIFKHYY